jgi:uncharacterized oxidoreductase
MVTVKAGALADLVRDIFAKAGCSTAEAERIGKYLVSANLTGHDSHGVARVPRYLYWKANGTVVADRSVKIVTETPVLAVVDGLHGFGQTVAPQAVEIGIRKAKQNGLSMIALRNAGHIGLVAPFGGTERRLSTAPFVAGVPRPGEEPVILDFATSIVAEGKVLVASQGGKKLPEGALIGKDGTHSTDPHLLYGDYTPTGPRDHSKGTGAIRAFGDHKGSGLALMCELLGGSLTGMSATGFGRRFGNGMLSFYVDPKVIDPENVFPEDAARYIAFFKSAKPAEVGGEVLTPGEPERRMRAERTANGVPLPDDTWASIVAAARELGVDENRIQQAGAI